MATDDEGSPCAPRPPRATTKGERSMGHAPLVRVVPSLHEPASEAERALDEELRTAGDAGPPAACGLLDTRTAVGGSTRTRRARGG